MIVRNHIHNARQRRADAVIGSAFPRDDFISGAADVLVNFPACGLVQFQSAQMGEIIQRQTADIHERPGEYLRIAFFTDDLAVDVLCIYTQMSAQ